MSSAGDTTNQGVIALRLALGKDISRIITANITGHDAQGLVDVGELPEGETLNLADQLSDGYLAAWARANLANSLTLGAPPLQRRAPVSRRMGLVHCPQQAPGRSFAAPVLAGGQEIEEIFDFSFETDSLLLNC